MYRISREKHETPALRWGLPDRVFFACGACHILAWTFLNRYAPDGAKALWIKPAPGYAGNHIIVDGPGWTFDYRGYSTRERLLQHMSTKANRWWPGWRATLHELPTEALVSGPLSRTYDGLWLREPDQFLHNATPRAEAYLDRFPPPPE